MNIILNYSAPSVLWSSIKYLNFPLKSAPSTPECSIKSHLFKQGKAPESRYNVLAREEKRFSSPHPSAKSWEKTEKTRGAGGGGGQTEEAADSDGLSLKGKCSYSVREEGLCKLRGQTGAPNEQRWKEDEERLFWDQLSALINRPATSNVIKVEDPAQSSKRSEELPLQSFQSSKYSLFTRPHNWYRQMIAFLTIRAI